jgi:glutamate 5-kinase
MSHPRLAPHRARLGEARRLVVKIGSSVLASLREGIDETRIEALCREVARLHAAGRQVILVSSGAVAAGAAQLGLSRRPSALPELQAAAAVGQGRLMACYAQSLAAHDLDVGQMLLTRDGLDERRRYLNARNTLSALLGLGVVPVINENDTVAVEEIQFGDNDQLSAMVAVMAEADALLILSDVDGLHERPPSEGESPVLEHVPAITPAIEALAGVSQNGVGRGGMASKLLAAKRTTAAGILTVIAPGRRAGVLGDLARGDPLGTCFTARDDSVSAKKSWLAGRQPVGVIQVDNGARRAVVEGGKSLLPIGMTKADRGIEVGDTVTLVDEDGAPFARGICNFSGAELARIAGRQSGELAAILGYDCAATVVHRDNLVLTHKTG